MTFKPNISRQIDLPAEICIDTLSGQSIFRVPGQQPPNHLVSIPLIHQSHAWQDAKKEVTMRKPLKAALLCGTLLLGLGAAGAAVAETNPMFGHAIVQKTSVAENKAVVGKGAYADYYGYYGNYYNSIAGQYGAIGYAYNSYSNYYAAYSYSTAASNYYYAAYYNQYYGL